MSYSQHHTHDHLHTQHEWHKHKRHSWRLTTATTQAVADSRHIAADTLRQWGVQDENTLYDVVLAVSELVTNAISYAEPPIRAVLRLDACTISFEICDGSHQETHGSNADRSDFGRGIAIVSAIVDVIGITHTKGGKSVWFTKRVA